MSATRIATKTYTYSFGLNKQSAIGTAINAAKITKRLPMEGFAPIGLTIDSATNDRNRFGKGHDFATFNDRVTQRLVIPQRGFSLSPTSAVWIPSFVFGDVSTATPEVGRYVHTFTFLDKAAQQECMYTSILEDAGAYKELIVGAVINSFTLDFSKDKHVMISWDGQARSRATSVISVPALTTEECFFKALAATFKLSAAPASDISASILGGSLTCSQNPEVHYMPGEAEADIGKVSYFLIGKQTVTGNLRVLMNSTLRDLFINGTECELEITLDGLTHVGATTGHYKVVITIPHLKIATGDISEEGEWSAMTLAFTDETVLKGTGDDVITFAVHTSLAATDILVSSS